MKQRENTFTDDELIAAHAELKTMAKIAAHFKVPHVSIWRRSVRLGLEYQKNGGKSGSYALQDILDGKHPYYQTNKLRIRLLNEGIFTNICSECGITEHNGKSLVMQLDHIDGDSSNHVLTNLRLLCPNCHSQTHTYCGKNK